MRSAGEFGLGDPQRARESRQGRAAVQGPQAALGVGEVRGADPSQAAQLRQGSSPATTAARAAGALPSRGPHAACS